jgi:hypothetical protein
MVSVDFDGLPASAYARNEPSAWLGMLVENVTWLVTPAGLLV